MLRRPVIAILFSFLIGILVSHGLPPGPGVVRLFPFFAAAVLLASIMIAPARWKGPMVLLLFFLSGIIVDQGKHRPCRLEGFSSAKTRVLMEGTVLETLQRSGEFAKFRILIGAMAVQGTWIPLREHVLATVHDHAPSFQPGEKVRFPATLKSFQNFKNPGAYDYESAMAERGFSCGASVPDGRRMVPLGAGRLPFPLDLVEHLRRPVRKLLAHHLHPRERALMSALILGERHSIEDETREVFARSGLTHILAVSGLHIGLIAAIVFFLARLALSFSYRLALQTDIRKVAAAIACVPVVAYTALAGFQVSSQRAMIMVLAFLLSLMLGKQRDVWSVLGLAALVILALDPHAVFSISFQLSFGAVIAILWLTPGILQRVQTLLRPEGKRGRPLRGPILYLAGLVTVTGSVTVFLLPLSSLHFHRLSLVTIPANLMVLPILGFCILPSALLSAAAVLMSPDVAGVFLKISAWGLNAAMSLIHFWADLSWSSIWTFIPGMHEIFLFYGILFLLLHLRRFRWGKGLLLVLLLLSLMDAAYWLFRSYLHPDLRITYLDVGQGNAALVELPRGKRMLIDGGGFSQDRFDVGQRVVAPYLWRQKILQVHYLVLSHPQADHMNGLRFIAKTFRPEEFWYNGDRVENEAFSQLLAAIDSRKIVKVSPREFNRPRDIQGVRIEILSHGTLPDGGPCISTRDGINDRSLVLKISFRGISFLFPGDIERRGEECLLATAGQSLESHVLLSPHHGSRTSNSEAFLRRVDPEVTIISSGSARDSDFPHPWTLERLDRLGSRILRIDRSGAVMCSVGEHGLQVETYLQGRRRFLQRDHHAKNPVPEGSRSP